MDGTTSIVMAGLALACVGYPSVGLLPKERRGCRRQARARRGEISDRR